ncbi:response regulator [Paenibacillus mendelii]|uniref:Response regulator n=1 Tax=Paenibacillus mendelii TaxID=206163 RepID=A0ABV6J9V0_9BACL|nr:response regulator [Paenibacillus mendelii]MCQ6560983.1 response regulator [Paenibacillus mendelii]
MVVDDAAFMRQMLKDVLRAAGHEIAVEAANGEEAVYLYKQMKPDLVTMDITMPEMDGVEALKAIKKHDPQAKVIMCSAIGQKSMVINAIQAGAKDFIVKPFHKDRVLETIRKVMGN